MTEEEWLSGWSSGRMLEHIKRTSRFPPQVRARKCRLAALGILHRHFGPGIDPQVVSVMEAVERLCEDQATFREVSGVVQAAKFPPRRDGSPNWSAIVHDLGSPDASTCIRGIAGATHVGPDGKNTRAFERTPFVGVQCSIIRDVFGNPFRAIEFDPSWQTSTAIALAQHMYNSRDFGAMPILADALQDADCEDELILNHCRDLNQVHVRGCWVVDLVLGKA